VSTETPVRRRVEQVMGLPVSLALRGRHASGERAEDAWQECLRVLREVDRVFSTWREDSHVSRLGRGEITLADCPAEVHEVLALGERARVESAGAFDVRRPGRDGRVTLDPSGVVKGWAVERAARVFDGLPATDFCLSAGGDMVCRTHSPDAPPWRIGIEDPHDPTRLVATVPVRNGAVATSGLVHRGAHIVDARTGSTPAAVASVTVVGPDLVWADIDATAAFALGGEALAWLRGRAGRRGLVVWSDGSTDLFGAQASAATVTQPSVTAAMPAARLSTTLPRASSHAPSSTSR
jgi:thiamine biosynthesis lipoprotein